jgi:transcriptional regulator with XRE-family HTH domain
MPVTDVREVGSAIRERRAELGLTISQLAVRSGVSIRLISELERGKRPGVTFSSLLRILTMLGLDLEIARRSGMGRPSV